MDIQELVNFAKQSQGQLSWDTSSLIRVSGLLAVKVNTLQNLSGQEKQKLICQVLKLVLEEVEKKEVSEETTEQFASLKRAVDDVIPASLDLALAAARGKLDLKKVKISVWVKYFSCCARSVVTALASTNVISDVQAKQATDALVAVEANAVADVKDAAAEEEDKSKFEQVNPMHKDTEETKEKSESSTQESKAPETHQNQAESESKDTTQ